MYPIINPNEEEFNRWLSTQTMNGTVGGNRLADLAQPQGLNTIRSSSGRNIDLGYAAPGGSGFAPDGRRAAYDPHVDGPREISRTQRRDGTFEVIKEVPAMDGFGRQSSTFVKEIETPNYLNPAALKNLEYQTKMAQLQKLQAEANDAMGIPMGGMTTDQASQKFLERKFGKAPPGYRFTQSGELEATPGGPADQKAQAKAAGAADVDIALGTLRDAYSRLEQGGGITSTDKGHLDNIAARISSSDIGQGVGKALGTSNQSARNDIAMTRPALLAALMKATGMSAKQMDSNAELKLWLTTATDPTLDVESNRRALDNIEKKYLGGQSVADAGKQPAQPNKSNLSSQDMQALDWAMKNKADPRAQQIMQKLGIR